MKSILSIPIFMDGVSAKLTPSRLATLVVIMYTSSLPTALAQFRTHYECDKYCHDSCSDYFPGPQFSACVQANVHCSCNTKFSTKNPLLIFVLVACLMFTLFCCGMCYRLSRYNRGRASQPQRIVAHPVVPGPVLGAISGRRSSSTNNNASSNHQRNLRGYVNPLAPQKSNDIPPEYLPPPAYNECVIDMADQGIKSEKSLT